MFQIKVVKFGGTSVKNLARIQHVAELVKNMCQPGSQKVITVVSAMGDTTDYLLKLGEQCAAQPDRRELDLLLSTGEQISIALVSMSLHNLGVKARSLTGAQVGIFTESIHNKARIIDIRTETLQEAMAHHDVIVVAGFQGVTANGDITTLGRGGSDTTAVALAAALNAEECDIFTDVDGIFTADPNKIATARLLKRVSYGEVLEMARLGSQVLHPRAVDLGRQYGVKIRVRNTFKPEHCGTLIDQGEKNVEIYRSLSGVATDKDQALMAIIDVPDQPGIAGRITAALAKQAIGIDMIVQSYHPSVGHNNISFTVHLSDLAQTRDILNKLLRDLGAREVLEDEDVAKISLIGAGLAGQPEIPATMFSALGEAKINIKMISTSDSKITCVVARSEADRAAELIHKVLVDES